MRKSSLTRPSPNLSLFSRLTLPILQEKILTEFQLQHLWFEHLLPKNLSASDGKSFQIIQTGWWNHESGPDFRDAVIQDETGKMHFGDIEIHLNTSDWKSHQHQLDPNYHRLILHIALQGSPISIIINGKSIPTIVLSSQLPEPLPQLLLKLPETNIQPLPLAQPGACPTSFKQMEPSLRHLFLQEAGWHRLHLKSEKLSHQIQRDGFLQTLWESLAETLGYKENKIPFRYLARLYPISKMKKIPEHERDALLFGASGFLPKIETATWLKENRHYAAKLWHRWWSQQEQNPKIPNEIWRLSHTRPANHPQRRIAALSLLAEKISEISILFKNQNLKKIKHLLLSLRHSFFSSHYTLKSKPSSQSLALLGEPRINDIIINLVFPWFLAYGWKEKEIILQLPAKQKNLVTNLMTQRLFSFSFKPKNALEQQGLLQIFYTFCAGNYCKTCHFPQFLENWISQNSNHS